MLVSAVMDPRVLLGSVRAVVVDEIHAFAGDDRGWHLLALLASVAELAGPAAACRIVGHSRQCARPADLAAGRGRQSQLGGEPAEHGPVMADVEVDYVGSRREAVGVRGRDPVTATRPPEPLQERMIFVSPKAERRFGRRHFLELLSVSPRPLSSQCCTGGGKSATWTRSC